MAQAKDIPDANILAAVERSAAKRGITWANRWDIEADFPDFPPKVVFAKLALMVRRGRLLGCPCGCRGDFEPIPNQN